MHSYILVDILQERKYYKFLIDPKNSYQNLMKVLP